ncbi:hypothetical protein GCM10028825_23620 [Spirosoma agri]
MTPRITLTAKELVRHLGQQVQIDSAGHPKHGEIGLLNYVRDRIDGNSLTPTVGICFDGDSIPRLIPLQSVRLLLRPLANLAEHEAKQCFRMGYPYWDQREAVSLIRSETQIDIRSGPIKLVITEAGVITSERWTDGLASPARINVQALLNYLDSRGIDTRSYIDQGLAIAVYR